MDTVVDAVHVKGKGVVGCKRHLRDIMVTFSLPGTEGRQVDFYDYFLTTEQAKELHQQLETRMLENSVKITNDE